MRFHVPRLPPHRLRSVVAAALKEDRSGDDMTTRAALPPSIGVRASLIARSRGVVAGLDAFRETFRQRDARVRVRFHVRDGAIVRPGRVVADVRGPAGAVLAAERTALNLVQHLSGVASCVRRCVERVRGTAVEIRHTRKTLPGLRALQLHAVRVGGGRLHRSHLASGILIKDNHFAAAGARDAAAAGALVRRVRARAGRGRTVEVEIQDLRWLPAILAAGADIVMFDNLPPTVLRRGVREVRAWSRRTGHRVIVEASGGITPETVRAIAGTGVDWISLGLPTHSAPALDFSLEVAGPL